MGKLTHEQLVIRACRWLRSKKRCRPVFAEFQVMANAEQPDAIGWTSSGIVHVVEAKVSRADFLRDAKKWHRLGDDSMGHYRWYVAPPGLIWEADLDGAGLLKRSGRGLCIVVPAIVRRMSPRGTGEAKQILRQAVIRHEDGVEWRRDVFRFAPLHEKPAEPPNITAWPPEAP